MQTVMQKFRAFAHQHDDVPAFHAAYLVGTFLAAAVMHTGFFAIIVALHMCLDYVKYRDLHGYGLRTTVRAIALENVTDIVLLMVALTIGIYLSHVYILAIVSGLLRSQLTILRAVGTILPRMRILEHVLLIAFDLHTYMLHIHPDIEKPLNRVQRWSLVAIAVLTVLLLLTPVFYQWDWLLLGEAVVEELAIRL